MCNNNLFSISPPPPLRLRPSDRRARRSRSQLDACSRPGKRVFFYCAPRRHSLYFFCAFDLSSTSGKINGSTFTIFESAGTADKKDVTLSMGVNQACDSLDICPCASAPLIPYYTVKSTQRESRRRMAARFFSAKSRRQPPLGPRSCRRARVSRKIKVLKFNQMAVCN